MWPTPVLRTVRVKNQKHVLLVRIQVMREFGAASDEFSLLDGHLMN